jgi:hypothetical protein
VGSPVDPERVQPVKVVERFENALAGKAVECSKQKHVETALGGILPHVLESGAVAFRA